jgi:hypothetical protein
MVIKYKGNDVFCVSATKGIAAFNFLKGDYENEYRTGIFWKPRI